MGSVPNSGGRRLGGLLIALALFCVACGSSGGGSSGSTTQPSPAPTTGSGQTADANGTWSGRALDSSGPGAMVLQLTQNGTAVSGVVTITDTSTGLTARGTVSGTVSASLMHFSIAIPAGGIETQPSCTAIVSGDAQVSGTSMTGTYTGSSSCTGAISSGQITLNRQ